MKKPDWVIEKERARKDGERESVWLFGLHAVRNALENTRREKLRLMVTPNALARLGDAVAASGLEPEVVDPRRFSPPIDAQSVHQGVALEVRPLDWGGLADLLAGEGPFILLDRVSDPHNVGAILRSAEVFGARAVIAPRHHSAPETGALAKAASGALERLPYLHVPNLAEAMIWLRKAGVMLIGLEAGGEVTLAEALSRVAGRPLGVVLGAEGPGLRERTRSNCDLLARIAPSGAFGSLNVSNAAAVALYAVQSA